MKAALPSEELARLIFSAHDPSNVKKLKTFLSENKSLWDSLDEPLKSSVESAIYATDKIGFSVYGDRAWSLGF